MTTNQPPPPTANQPPPPTENSGLEDLPLSTLAVGAGVGWLVEWLMGWFLLALALALAVGALLLVNAVTGNSDWAAGAFFGVFAIYYLRGIVSSIRDGVKDPGHVMAIIKNCVFGGIAAVLAIGLFAGVF